MSELRRFAAVRSLCRGGVIAAGLFLSVLAVAAPLGGARAATLATIYSFTGGSDGTMPTTGLVSGPKGVFYGATSTTVYSLTEDGQGKWHEVPIYASGFPGVNSLVGTTKALYGSLGLGSGKPCPQEPSEGCGSIVQLTPPAKGGTSWTATTIYDFKGGKLGLAPDGIAIDSTGTIFGVTADSSVSSICGSLGCGTVFKLARTSGKWKLTVLHEFKGGSDGQFPRAAPSFDLAGNVYASTYLGGGFNTARPPSCEGGGVYVSIGHTTLTYMWKDLCDTVGPDFADAVILLLLSQNDPRRQGASEASAAPPPVGAADAAIITSQGGGNTADCANLGNNGCGLVALLSEPKSGKAPWKLKTLHNFSGADGAAPSGSLLPDGANAIYGVAQLGGTVNQACAAIDGSLGCGTIFKLVKKSAGWAWGGKVYSFPGGANGGVPVGQLTLHKRLILGTTAFGGSTKTGCGNQGCGTIFALTP